MPHNLWLGGDYSNNIGGLTLYGASAEVSNEWSTNYNNSLKITKTSSSTQIYLWYYHEYNSENKTLQLSINQRITTGSYHLQIVQYDNNKTQLDIVQMGVWVSSTNPIILTTTTVENVKYISIRIYRYGDVGSTLFLDNAIVTEN